MLEKQPKKKTNEQGSVCQANSKCSESRDPSEKAAHELHGKQLWGEHQPHCALGPSSSPRPPALGGAPARTSEQCQLLTCQHILNTVVMHEVVCSAGSGGLILGQRLLQVDLQPIQGRQATVVLQRGRRGSQLQK